MHKGKKTRRSNGGVVDKRRVKKKMIDNDSDVEVDEVKDEEDEEEDEDIEPVLKDKRNNSVGLNCE